MPDNNLDQFSLRPLEQADLTFITKWFQDVRDLAVFDRSSRIPYDFAACERLWDMSDKTEDTSGKCWFAITSDATEVIGIIGLESISAVNRDAVIALYVDQSIRRKGVGIRAAALVLDFAFHQLGLKRVTSYYRSDNVSSRDLTKQAGFDVEGTMRRAWFADGTFHDMIVVGILADEWTDRRGALADELGPETIIAFGDPMTSASTWPPQYASISGKED